MLNIPKLDTSVNDRRSALKVLALSPLALTMGCGISKDPTGPITPLLDGTVTGTIARVADWYDGFELSLSFNKAGSYRYQAFSTHKNRVELVGQLSSNDSRLSDDAIRKLCDARYYVQVLTLGTDAKLSVRKMNNPTEGAFHDLIRGGSSWLVQAFKNYKYSVKCETDIQKDVDQPPASLKVSTFAPSASHKYYQVVRLGTDGKLEAARLI